jgi:hypothetical protein
MSAAHVPYRVPRIFRAMTYGSFRLQLQRSMSILGVDSMRCQSGFTKVFCLLEGRWRADRTPLRPPPRTTDTNRVNDLRRGQRVGIREQHVPVGENQAQRRHVALLLSHHPWSAVTAGLRRRLSPQIRFAAAGCPVGEQAPAESL